MSHRTVSIIYSKKDKQLTYKDVVVIKGGSKVKSTIASRILEELPARPKIGTTYCITLETGNKSCTYKISVAA